MGSENNKSFAGVGGGLVCLSKWLAIAVVVWSKLRRRGPLLGNEVSWDLHVLKCIATYSNRRLVE